MLSKQFIQDYFNADFKSIDSLLNDVLVPIFGDFDQGFTEITVATDKAKEMARAAHIKTIQHVATFEGLGLDIKVFDVTLDDRCHIHQARKNIQALVRQFVDRFEGAFIVFHYEDPTNRSWRLSYLEKRESNTASTNAKRYTYLCGQQYPCRTLAERFEKLQTQDLTAVNLETAFSVEALSNEFFDEYRYFYQDLVNYVKFENNLIDGFIDYADGDKELAEKCARDYIKKLMGRLVFIQFLQNKAWLNNDIHYTHSLFDSCDEEKKYNFLDKVLEPLFFGVFNTPKEAREALFRKEHWDMKLFEEWKDFPYLNGGLFECDELDKLDLPLPAYFFSNPERKDHVRTPNDQYYEDACGIFDFFDRYNFTIDESDPLDREVGVDPEMLGKIFENLLEDNKDKGAFYTPKEIVDYMCKEALIAYLVDEARRKSEVNKQRQENFEDAIRAFVNDPEMTVIRMQKYGDQQLIDLNESLCSVKICDPAIGSGAFPMGLLNLLINCRVALNNALHKGEPRAWLKKEIIQNNIYGVDIEKGAIDIARLRFWLSIVVDLDNPEALPNFDYKFMQGNSLLEQFEGRDLSNMFDTTGHGKKNLGVELIAFDEVTSSQAILQEQLHHYFTMRVGDKHLLRKKVNDAVINLIKEKVNHSPQVVDKLNGLDVSANDQFFLWHTWFADVFNRPSKQGFDIVIGNPPYISALEAKKILPASIRLQYKNKYQSACGTYDMYIIFLELGLRLLCPNGVLSFITPSKYLSAEYASALRSLILANYSLNMVSDFSDIRVFKSAGVSTIISQLSNCEQKTKVTFNKYRTTTEIASTRTYSSNVLSMMPNNLWGYLLSEQVDLFLKIFNKSTTIEEHADVNACTTAAEAEEYENSLTENESVNAFKFVNNGTIQRYVQLWGKKAIKTGHLLRPYLEQKHISERRKDMFLQEKLIFVKLAKYPQVFLDELGEFASANTNMVYNLHGYDYKFLLGYLNSSLFNFVYHTMFGGLSMLGTIQMQAPQIKKSLIPLLQKEAQQQPIIDLVDAILAAKAANPQADTASLEAKIDSLVYQLYNLTPEEIALIEQ